ncbi:MAG: ATP-grasp domain-containing protein [Myxococcales bacterium]|nr:ATP-grasp domain-containing protein [Myxococcales bacterium]USN50090.1 MAG: ATP-grasp domain-containing protein [Myxococcales bacterium]
MSHNIIILFGGESNERLVSVASAQYLARALKHALLWYWHKNGTLYQVESAELLAHKNPFTEEFSPSKSLIFRNIVDAINSDAAQDHVFILALHGGSGENGSIQELLEKANRAYTGSDAKSSRVAFDKLATKKALDNFPIKMAAQHLLDGNNANSLEKQLTDFMDEFGAIVVKPSCGGSSLGCSIVKIKAQFEKVIEEILKNPQEIYFCEQMIDGRELSVGVIETLANELTPLPVTEICVDKSRCFDYQGKYLGAGSKEITPADIPQNIALEAQRLAAAAHRALSLYGYSRTDIIVNDKGLYFLEINTLPGLSQRSFIPQQLAAAHISATEFLHQQIKLAQLRQQFCK